MGRRNGKLHVLRPAESRRDVGNEFTRAFGAIYGRSTEWGSSGNCYRWRSIRRRRAQMSIRRSERVGRGVRQLDTRHVSPLSFDERKRMWRLPRENAVVVRPATDVGDGGF